MTSLGEHEVADRDTDQGTKHAIDDLVNATDAAEGKAKEAQVSWQDPMNVQADASLSIEDD